MLSATRTLQSCALNTDIFQSHEHLGFLLHSNEEGEIPKLYSVTGHYLQDTGLWATT